MCSNCTCQTNREARCCVWIKTCLLCYDWLSLLCHTCKHDIPCGVKSFLILLFWDGDCNSLHRSVKRGVVWKCEWCSLDVCYYMFKTVFCRKREDKIINIFYVLLGSVVVDLKKTNKQKKQKLLDGFSHSIFAMLLKGCPPPPSDRHLGIIDPAMFSDTWHIFIILQITLPLLFCIYGHKTVRIMYLPGGKMLPNFPFLRFFIAQPLSGWNLLLYMEHTTRKFSLFGKSPRRHVL